MRSSGVSIWRYAESMKNYTHLDFFSRIRRSTLLVVAAGAFLYIVTAPSFAQEPHESSEARRVQVESSLLPDSPIAGEKGWSLTERMQYYRVPGVQIAAVKGGKLDWTRGYGLADTKTRRRVTSETVFDAGSTSKAVTAILTMKLVEQGKLSLDAPINDFLTSWKLPENDFTRKTPVTLQRLLSHTAGTNVGGFWGYLENDPLPTLTQILDGLPPAANGPVRVEAEPGKAWRYSGGGFVIIPGGISAATVTCGPPTSAARSATMLVVATTFSGPDPTAGGPPGGRHPATASSPTTHTPTTRPAIRGPRR